MFSADILPTGIINYEKVKRNIVFNKFSILYLKHSYWVNYSYKATINQKGLLRVTENNGMNKLHRASDYHLTDNTLALIKEKLRDVASIEFNNNYGFGENKPAELPVTFIQYNVDNKADLTSIYVPDDDELPEELKLFLSTFERIISENDVLINH